MHHHHKDHEEHEESSIGEIKPGDVRLEGGCPSLTQRVGMGGPSLTQRVGILCDRATSKGVRCWSIEIHP